MRRWSVLLTAFGLLAMGPVGCWEHTAGVCDVDPWHDHQGFLDMPGTAHSYADVPHAGGAMGPLLGNEVTRPVAMPQAAE
jgi:hypothetical protein